MQAVGMAALKNRNEKEETERWLCNHGQGKYQPSVTAVFFVNISF